MMTLEKAYEIAKAEIERITRESDRLRNHDFSEVHFRYEDEWNWTFSAGSRQLQEAGYIPGAVFAVVDKKDGHLWSREEEAEFYEQREKSRRQQQVA